MDFKTKILAIARRRQFGTNQFDSVGIYDWPEIMKKIEARFVIKVNSNTKFNWWRERLKSDSLSIQFPQENAWEYLHLLVPKNEKVWLVACEERRDPTQTWLFEGFIEPIQHIIGALPTMEYYIVSKKYEWLLTEHHYKVLIGMGTMKDALVQLRNNVPFSS